MPLAFKMNILKTIVRFPTSLGTTTVTPRLAWDAQKVSAVREIVHAEEKEAWVYLFADLVCVVVVQKSCITMLKCGLAVMNVLASAVMFLLFFMTRLSMDDYSNRFSANDYFNRVMYFVFTVGLFLMAQNAQAFKLSDVHVCSDHKVYYFFGFCYGFLTTRFALITIYARLMLADAKAREQFTMVIIRFVLTSIIVIGILLSEVDDEYSGRAKIRFFSLIFIIEFGLVLFDSLIHSSAHKYFALLGYFHKRVNYYYPLDIYRHQNRLGIFIMMVLGEIVLELGVPPYDYKVMPQVVSFSLFGLLLSFSLAIQYYDAVHRSLGDAHAMTRSVRHSFFYTWMHPVVGFCLLLIFVATTKLTEAIHAQRNEVPFEYRYLLCVACSMVVGGLTLMRMLHKGMRNAMYSPFYLTSIVFMLSHLTVSCSSLSFTYDIVMHSLLACALAIRDLYYSEVKRGAELAEGENNEHLQYHDGSGSNVSAPLLHHSVDVNDPEETSNQSLPIPSLSRSNSFTTLQHDLSMSDTLFARRYSNTPV